MSLKKNPFSIRQIFFFTTPTEEGSTEIKNNFFQCPTEDIDWWAANYFSENKVKISSILYTEVQSDLQASLTHRKNTSEVQTYKR